jgi:hypothetical protein
MCIIEVSLYSIFKPWINTASRDSKSATLPALNKNKQKSQPLPKKYPSPN